MSRVLTAAEICARSLRAIGAFPVTESAPDGESLREAMSWLDLIMSQTAGTERLFSRVDPATLSVTITNGTASYDFYTALGSSLPLDRVQFVVDAWIDDDLGNRHPVEITTRQKFEDVCLTAKTGVPYWIYIDRTAAPTLRIFPTPVVTDPRTYTLKLIGQRYAPNVAPSGVTGTRLASAVLHDFGVAWQRWLVCQLAHDLGAGPIHKLPKPSLDEFSGMAVQAMARLLAFENREQETTPPVCEPWGDDYGCFSHPSYPNWGRY